MVENIWRGEIIFFCRGEQKRRRKIWEIFGEGKYVSSFAEEKEKEDNFWRRKIYFLQRRRKRRKIYFLWRRRRTEKELRNYLGKEINGDADQPPDRQGEFSAICLFEG